MDISVRVSRTPHNRMLDSATGIVMNSRSSSNDGLKQLAHDLDSETARLSIKNFLPRRRRSEFFEYEKLCAEKHTSRESKLIGEDRDVVDFEASENEHQASPAKAACV